MNFAQWTISIRPESDQIDAEIKRVTMLLDGMLEHTSRETSLNTFAAAALPITERSVGSTGDQF